MWRHYEYRDEEIVSGCTCCSPGYRAKYIVFPCIKSAPQGHEQEWSVIDEWLPSKLVQQKASKGSALPLCECGHIYSPSIRKPSAEEAQQEQSEGNLLQQSCTPRQAGWEGGGERSNWIMECCGACVLWWLTIQKYPREVPDLSGYHLDTLWLLSHFQTIKVFRR